MREYLAAFDTSETLREPHVTAALLRPGIRGPSRNGFTITQRTTRGALRKLFATCQAPGTEAVKQLQQYNEAVEASQRHALAEQKQYVEMMNGRMNGDTTDPGTYKGSGGLTINFHPGVGHDCLR